MRIIKKIFRFVCCVFNCDNYLFYEIDSHKWESKIEIQYHYPETRLA